MTSVKEFPKSRGTIEYCSSQDGILICRWMDNKPVSFISSYSGVNPLVNIVRKKSKGDVHVVQGQVAPADHNEDGITNPRMTATDQETIGRKGEPKGWERRVPAPNLLRHYNMNMGGVDKSDMLVSLYRTPLKAKR